MTLEQLKNDLIFWENRAAFWEKRSAKKKNRAIQKKIYRLKCRIRELEDLNQGWGKPNKTIMKKEESQFVEIGDYVDAIFSVDKNGIPDSIIKAAKVIKKHFVKEDFPYAYDLEITIALDENAGRVTTRVYNVGTGFCVKRTKEYLENEEATKYIKSHLVSFGEYLLSGERTSRIEGEANLVHHADLENWSDKSKQ